MNVDIEQWAHCERYSTKINNITVFNDNDNHQHTDWNKS